MSEASDKKNPPLPWVRALGTSLLTLAVILPVAIAFNMLIGRTIHWDIVAVLAGGGFVTLTLAFRYLR